MSPEINSLAIIPYNYSSYDDHLEFNDKLVELKNKLSDISGNIFGIRLGRIEILKAKTSLDDIQSQAHTLKKNIEINNYTKQSGALEDINKLIVEIENTFSHFNKRHLKIFTSITEIKSSKIAQQIITNPNSLKNFETWISRCDELSLELKRQHKKLEKLKLDSLFSLTSKFYADMQLKSLITSNLNRNAINQP